LRRSARVLALLVVLALLSPSATAVALTLHAPKNVLRQGTVTLDVSSTDATGTAVLLVDGLVMRSLPALPSTVVTFTAVPLALGARTLQAGLRDRDGLHLTSRMVVSSWDTPLPPVLVSPSSGYSAQRAPLVVKVGGSTTSLKLIIDGSTVKQLSVKPNAIVSFGTVNFLRSPSTVSLVASNPIATKTYTFRIRRLLFPWPTCIVIDKSDFKLYWVKNGVLVKAYPIAHGKPSTPTPSAIWRVGAKYFTSPGGIYGPRKLRLFRKVGSTYEYTRYGIHGTNEPWVIGTQASHGCIRMRNSDILELFPQVPLGTMVQTRD